jgi:hypothetical protein
MMGGEPGNADTGTDHAGVDRARIDTTTVHPARRYNYWLGGKDNFAADRQSGDDIAKTFPSVRIAALENRAFMRRAVAYLTAEAGIRQFLDIGTGIPVPGNTHEIAQAFAPESRVVYVDNDPIVMSHARALLNSSPEGATAYLEADVRDWERALHGAKETLDLNRPVAIMLVAVLHFLADEADPYQVVRELVGALPDGSYLLASHVTYDFLPRSVLSTVPGAAQGPGGVVMRGRDDIARFFDGMDLVDPGMVPPAEWRPTDPVAARPSPADTASYAGLAKVR